MPSASFPAPFSAAAPPAPRSGPAAPLVITQDDGLLDALLEILAAGGREPSVAPDAAMAGAAWAAAPLVLVGADAVPNRPPVRRPDVLIVGHGALDDAVWRDAVRIGADDVLDVARDAAVLRARVDSSTGAVGGSVIAVAAAGGGLGATTLAAVLARRGVDQGLRVLLVDLSPDSGGLDLVLGAEDEPGARWGDLDPVEGAVDPSALLEALPRSAGLALLSAGRDAVMPGETARVAVLRAARRAVDLVVVDAGRPWWPALSGFGGPDPIGVLLAAGDLCGAAAARLAVPALASVVAEPRLVVRTGRGRTAAAEQVAEAVGLPLVATLPDDPRAASARAHGRLPALRGRSPWSAAADRILAPALYGAQPR